MTIKQGHRYSHKGRSVLALESAADGLVATREIRPLCPVLGAGPLVYVKTKDLVPEPMKYFRGAIA